jgi:hypothetical protein
MDVHQLAKFYFFLSAAPPPADLHAIRERMSKNELQYKNYIFFRNVKDINFVRQNKQLKNQAK